MTKANMERFMVRVKAELLACIERCPPETMNSNEQIDAICSVDELCVDIAHLWRME